MTGSCRHGWLQGRFCSLSGMLVLPFKVFDTWRPPMWYHRTVHRLFQDDLPSISISRLRASGVVTSDTKSVDIVFGEGNDGLRREVKVAHRRFPNGGE